MTTGNESGEQTMDHPSRRETLMMWGFIVAGLLLTLATVAVPAT